VPLLDRPDPECTAAGGRRGDRAERDQLAGEPRPHHDEIQGEAADGRAPRELRREATPGEPGATAIPGEHQPDGEAEDEAVVPGERREADEEARRDVGPRAALETKDGEPDGRRDERLEDREVLGL